MARSEAYSDFSDNQQTWVSPSVGYTFPGPMLVQFRTREFGVDLPSLDLRNARRSRRDSDVDVAPPTWIALGKTGNDRAKRCLDVALVVLAAPLWIPLLAVLVLAVKCTSRGPAFYAQERLGRMGDVFRCLKIRTMVIDADRKLEQLLSSDPALRSEFADAFKLRRDPHVTRLGRVLRKTGLDELPQLLSVFTGRMSLVGPRPIVSAEKEFYGAYLPLVQMVRPGMTGLWQVSGRSDLPYPMRVAFDVQYVLTRTLWSDVRVIVKTAVLMFRPSRRGSY